jgi:hypothetical protein
VTRAHAPRQVFKNAREYNIDGSEICSDANAVGPLVLKEEGRGTPSFRTSAQAPGALFNSTALFHWSQIRFSS